MRQEQGCIDILVYRGLEDENEFVVLEKWLRKEDVDVHQQSETFTVLKGTGSLMLHKPQLTMYTISHSEVITL